NVDRFACGNVTHERDGLVVGNADAAYTGIDANVNGYRFLQPLCDFIEGRAERSVDHRDDVARDGVREGLLVERTEEKDGLPYARVTKRVRFVQFDHGEA